MSPISLKVFEISFIICFSLAVEIPTTQILNGKIKGKSYGYYYAFKGIPYAEPPISENRFESPKPYTKKWNDTLDTTSNDKSCLRLDPEKKLGEFLIVGEEDCLYLNVYVPKIKEDKLLPVMFFIHGGAFMFGSADSLNEKTVMRNKKTILVTFDYRVGPFGFLSTEDDKISGNMGLKDQRMALQWVKNNIEAFGGDSEHILMAGFSAGGASVELQTMSLDIDGLVSSAVSFSGSALNPWVIKPNPLQDARKLAKILKCKNVLSTDNIKNCLKLASGKSIVMAVNDFFIFGYNPIRVFGPVIESKTVSDAFITKHPLEILRNGEQAKIPYLSSYVAQDGAIGNIELLRLNPHGKQRFEDFNKNLDKLMPIILFYDETLKYESEKVLYTQKLLQQYNLTRNNLQETDFNKLTELFTDLMFKNGIVQSWKLRKEFGSSPVYGYVYDNPPMLGTMNMILHRMDLKFGTVHGDDVYLFLHSPIRNLIPFRTDELKISKNFVQMLETFAMTGVPKFGNTDFPEILSQTNTIKFLKISAKNVSIQLV